MKLSESLFLRILAAMHAEGRPSGTEGAATIDEAEQAWNRRARRLTVNRPVWYVRHGATEGKPQAATVLDVSKVGIGVLLDAVAAPGERLIVYLPCAAGHGEEDDDGRVERGGFVPLLCTVRTCRIRSDGHFRVGAEFIDPNSADADGPGLVMSASGLLVDGEPGDSETTNRRSERHEADDRATMYLYRRGRQAPLERVAVADYSDHGVAIFRGEPLAVGQEFVVRVPREDDKPITRLCRVVNSTQVAGRYRIGAEFIPFRGRGLLGRLRDLIA